MELVDLTEVDDLVDDPTSSWEMETTLAAHFALNKCECNDMGEKDYSTTYAMYNFIVIMIILPVVAAFGIFSNFINCFIFTRPSLYSSVNVYLLALSCSDLLVVTTGVFIFFIDSLRVYIVSFTDIATQGIIWVLPLGFIAQTCSVYFTVAAATDCYVKICWTPLSGNWCTPLRAKILTLAITTFSIGYNALRFWQFQLNPCWDELHNASNIEVCPTELYYEIGVIYNVYMYMVLMTVLPFMLLSFLNVLIVRTVQRIRTMNKKLCTILPLTTTIGSGTNEAPSDDRSPMSDTSSDDKKLAPDTNASQAASQDDSVVTMVMVVILFLACNTLALIVNIVETFFNPDPLVVQYMTDTSNLLVVFNSSVNYVIYMFFDNVYRTEFQRCINCRSLCFRRHRNRMSSVYEAGNHRRRNSGASPVLYSARHKPLNDFESDEPSKQKVVSAFGSEYLSVPTSPSNVQPPVKSLSRFRSLQDDRDSPDDFPMTPLMLSSDGDMRKNGKKKFNKIRLTETIIPS